MKLSGVTNVACLTNRPLHDDVHTRYGASPDSGITLQGKLTLKDAADPLDTGFKIPQSLTPDTVS